LTKVKPCKKSRQKKKFPTLAKGETCPVKKTNGEDLWEGEKKEGKVAGKEWWEMDIWM